MIIINTGNKDENKAMQIVLLFVALCLLISSIQDSRNELLALHMPSWYLPIGNYSFFGFSFIWLCKAIWKAPQKKILQYIFYIMLLWLSPYIPTHNYDAILYFILLVMHITPIAMIFYLHRKPILSEYEKT